MPPPSLGRGCWLLALLRCVADRSVLAGEATDRCPGDRHDVAPRVAADTEPPVGIAAMGVRDAAAGLSDWRSRVALQCPPRAAIPR